ncbi:hypothetical protein [Streptacidiphilus cavernicola]|uniref:Helix-turn-helix domain-containing protein n=1 Tax=Streptacidiphilus cavernicola TaxID=3342716 RepID=A0ABV6VVI9_9ACTN
MRVHRSRHTGGFTVLPNFFLQDRRLSYTARGLLADLLSRHDGWSENRRHMADSSPQGRTAVDKAVTELIEAGYYRLVVARRANGTVFTEIHIFDTPQIGNRAEQPTPPAAGDPGSGAAASDLPGANPVKDLVKEPSLPEVRQDGGQSPVGRPETAGREGGRDASTLSPAARDRHAGEEAEGDRSAHQAAQTLLRVVAAEPRLRLGTFEALALAPDVLPWLERGCSEEQLRTALLPGLPDRVHSASSLLRDRLQRKLPPMTAQVRASGPVKPPLTECQTCGDPVRQAGICRACAGLGVRKVAVGTGEAVARRGAALVRAALRPADRQGIASRA